MQASTSQETVTPTSAEALQELIASANETGEPLEVVGGGSKRFWGRSVSAARTVSVAGLRAVVDYLPHELILVAQPGLPLDEVEALLEEKGQMLAFEPPHWGPGATLGGALACNLSGPRRLRAGAARDHLLGFQAVTGRGELIRGGGRVVKNVTGYDLSKLMCGSFGTLAVMSEVCVKVLPRPETGRTVVAPGLDDEQGLKLMIEAARSSHDVSGLAHLPSGLRLPAPVEALTGVGAGLTAIRVEGPGPSVTYRSEQLVQHSAQQTVFLEGEDSRAFWRALRELEPLPLGAGERLWRLSVPPTQGLAAARGLRRLGEPRLYYDWGGGLVWAVLPAKLKAAGVHAVAREAGGQAQLLHDPGGRSRENAVFSELSPGQHRLHLNLKNAFDPNHVLNPGRLYADL